MSLKISSSKSFIIIFLLGISSGLPLLAFDSLLKAWLKDSAVELSTIGYFGWVTLPYSLKLLWAPLLDRYTLPLFGRRRGWILFSQLFLSLSFLALGLLPAQSNVMVLSIVTFLGVFFSATQDIVIDAFRRESFRDEQLGLASSVFVVGYRVGMILAGGVALSLADFISWNEVFQLLSGAAAVMVLVTFFADEPIREEPSSAKTSLGSVFVEPFIEFLARPASLYVLAFAVLYKLGDTLADAMRIPFLLEIGFTKLEIGEYVKLFGLISAIIGGVIGGALMLRLGIARSLLIFGIFQMASTAGFVFLAEAGRSVPLLAGVIAVENFTGGMGTAAFVAFLATACNRAHSAAQYAALTSFMRLPALLVTTQSGWMAESMGWSTFFVLCVVIALPGLILVKRVSIASKL